MKKLLFVLVPILLSLFLFSCDEKDLHEEFSQDTALNAIKFVEVVDGVKINFSEKNITLVIRRDCPEAITMDANLPLGAKIIEVSEGLELKSDTTVKVLLNVSDQFFVIQAQDIETIEKYAVNIVNDKTDLSLHLIEQTFQKDGAFVWKHERDESGVLVSSRLVNVDNDKNFKTYVHETNASGFITNTSYTTNKHKHYTYIWKYDNQNLVSYDKQLFNGLPSHHFIVRNEDNLIVKLIKKNDFDYVLDEIDFTYDKENRIVKKTGVSLTFDQVYTYDDKNRLISSGEYDYEYDDYGNIVKQNSIVANLSSNYERTYNVDGSLATEKALNKDGSVASEYGFSYFDNGRIAKEVKVGGLVSYIYNEDGSYKYTSLPYDSDYRMSRHSVYDVNHNRVEYIRDITVDDRPSSSYKEERNYEYNANGLISKETYVRDNKDGRPVRTTVTDFEYNDAHLLVKRTTTTNSQFDNINKREYDANGMVTESAYYDVDNKKFKTYVYTYYNYGKTKSKLYENFNTGTVSETIWDYSASWHLDKKTEKKTINGDLKSERVTEYRQDGLAKKREEVKEYDNFILVRRTVREYDEDGMMISYVVYDGEGNVINSQTFQQNSRIPAFEESEMDFELVL